MPKTKSRNGGTDAAYKRYLRAYVRCLVENSKKPPPDTRPLPTIIRTRILDEMTRLYGISPKALLHGTKRGNATQARVMAIILFHKHLGLTKSEIAGLFGHSQPNIISLRLKTFENLQAGKPICESERRFEKVYSKDFMHKYKEADARISELKGAQSKPLTDWKKW